MSDGHPTDDLRKALEDANKNNRWFQTAIKVAMAIGDDADTNVLLELVGNREAVVQGIDMETLIWCFFPHLCILDSDRGNQDIKTDINSEDVWNDDD